jgi:hypothetical protein
MGTLSIEIQNSNITPERPACGEAATITYMVITLGPDEEYTASYSPTKPTKIEPGRNLAIQTEKKPHTQKILNFVRTGKMQQGLVLIRNPLDVRTRNINLSDGTKFVTVQGFGFGTDGVYTSTSKGQTPAILFHPPRCLSKPLRI